MGQSVSLNQGNFAIIQNDVAKIFVLNNRYDSGLFDEPDGSGEFTLAQGQLLGRIAASNKLKICSAVATDGSQYPIGVVASQVTMAESATDVTVNFCHAGDVVQSKVLLSGSETMASTVTVIASGPLATDYDRTLKDLIQASGIKLVGGDELTGADNE